MRITPPDEDVSLLSTRQVLEWLAFLADRDGPVSRPIRSLQGSLIEVLDYEGQTYLSTAFEKAPGVLAEKLPPEQWSAELFHSLGRAIGSWHRIATANIRPAKPPGDPPGTRDYQLLSTRSMRWLVQMPLS